VGGGGTQDVNLTQIQGAAPSATNPLPSRLSSGIGFIDPRDRNWTLSSPGDSVTVSGTVTANQGGGWTMSATQGTSPWVVSGTVTSNQAGVWTVQQGTPPWLVSGTVTSNQGGAPWKMRLQDGAGGTLATVTAANALKVDGSGVFQDVKGQFLEGATASPFSTYPFLVAGRDAGNYVRTVQARDTTPDYNEMGLDVRPIGYMDRSYFGDGAANSTTFSIGGIYNETSIENPTEDQIGALRITLKRGLHANLRDASGNEIASSTSAPVGTERGLMVRNIRTGTESVSLGTSSGKTVTMKTGSLVTTAATADQVILTYTVTAGKGFYLEYFRVDTRLTTFATTATYFGMASLENPSGSKLITQMQAGAGITNMPPLVFTEPVPIAAGTVIRVVCTPSSTTSYTWQANLGGYEK
jgi:hypothetical protein